MNYQVKSRSQFYSKSTQRNTQIEWILNLLDTIPKSELQQGCLQEISDAQVKRVADRDPLRKYQIYTYNPDVGKFKTRHFFLYQNLLLAGSFTEVDNQNDEKPQQATECLVLSSCMLEKKNISYKEHIAQGLRLKNQNGYCYIFFDNDLIYQDWYRSIKRFCKLCNFLHKFAVKEKLSIPNFYTCVKMKKNRVYTVQILRLQEMTKRYQIYEALMNELGILICCERSHFLLPFQQMYEDKQNFYIIYDYWSGELLSKTLQQQNNNFTQIQLGQIILQLIKAVKFLHLNGVYHGAINPQNIVIIQQNQLQQQNKLKHTPEFRLLLFNLHYREQNTRDYYWLIKKIGQSWIAPEYLPLYYEAQQKNKKLVKTMSKNVHPNAFDTYAIGCLLYFLTFQGQQDKNISSKHNIENMKIKYDNLIELQQQQNLDFQSYGKNFYSYSQLDLMVQLLKPQQEKRINLEAACKHVWFMNQKIKEKQSAPKQKYQFLSSLRTILEIREQSSCDRISSSINQEDDIDSVSEDDYDIEQENDNLHRISKESSPLITKFSQLPVQITQASRRTLMTGTLPQ